jgi:phosphoenolpyruvate-protein phosphotransferase
VLLLQSERFALSGLAADGPVAFGDTLFEVNAREARPAVVSEDEEGPELSQTVVVGLEHGIHARPAAALIEAIKPLEARVVCCFGDLPPANAASAVALMSLGVSCGDVVTVSARGRDAARALEMVVAALEPLEPDFHTNLIDQGGLPAAKEPAPISPPADGTIIQAQPASPGLGMGPAFQLGSEEDFAPALPGTVKEEQQLLDEALGKVRGHLEKLANTGTDTAAGIAMAHLALLDDPIIGEPARQQIEQGSSAVRAWQEAVDDAAAMLGRTDNKRMRERMDDLRDINLRMQRALVGQDPGKGLEIPTGAIVLADNLLPSQLMELDRERLRGVCLAAGGATSHVAILAISLGLPMLVAAGADVLAIEDGASLIIDAELGELLVCPDSESANRFEQRMSRDKAQRAVEQEQALDECRTVEGIRIHTFANIGSVQDALAAIKGGAEGCGLLRTEFTFMERQSAPSIDDQLAIYSRISDALGDRPMVVRTLDAGGDKPISYVAQAPEENPALGVRGIRLSLEEGELLRIQLQALLQLRRAQPLQVMIPMVSSVHEVFAVRELLDVLRANTDGPGDIRLGVMIETPAAALIACRLAEFVDFFSIGTNDLTQYTLCMDRGEPRFANQLDALHPAVLQLIKYTVDAARSANIPVAVCGGAAGDMLAAPVLIGLGVRELSMPGSLIARQKARLRTLSAETCATLATRALAMNSARDVRAMMRKFVLSGQSPPEGN